MARSKGILSRMVAKTRQGILTEDVRANLSRRCLTFENRAYEFE